ncbi:CBS domain-containing protein [Pseudoxanthomonas sp. SGD-10]|nr:CBS domain-containing protein [Pseudoxanthomonas sp. SGD-10]
MKSLKQFLGAHRRELITIDQNATVFEGLTSMMQHNISAILVVEDSNLKGIFTERDYARKIALQGKTSKEVRLHEVMTTNLITVSPEDSIESCMEIMTNNHIRHLPIMENQQLKGIISIGDIVKLVIEDQKQTIVELESYIRS